MPGLKRIQVGPGRDALPPAGHKKREELKRRTDNLARAAEEGLNATEQGVYSVDPEKLKEEPEILRHYDMSQHMFTVTNRVDGRVYFWESERPDAIARKKAEARMWLGPNGGRGWQIVQGRKNADGTDYPESIELMQADGTRKIGDVLLMWIPLNEYERIQKRILLATRYKEENFSEKLGDYVQKHEGLVKVYAGNEAPQDLYRKHNPGSAPLQHAGRMPAHA